MMENAYIEPSKRHEQNERLAERISELCNQAARLVSDPLRKSTTLDYPRVLTVLEPLLADTRSLPASSSKELLKIAKHLFDFPITTSDLLPNQPYQDDVETDDISINPPNGENWQDQYTAIWQARAAAETARRKTGMLIQETLLKVAHELQTRALQPHEQQQLLSIVLHSTPLGGAAHSEGSNITRLLHAMHQTEGEFEDTYDINWTEVDSLTSAFINTCTSSPITDTTLKQIFCNDFLFDIPDTRDKEIPPSVPWIPQGERVFQEKMEQHYSSQFDSYTLDHLRKTRDVLFQKMLPDKEPLSQEHVDLLLKWVKNAAESSLYLRELTAYLRRAENQTEVVTGLQEILQHHPLPFQREIAWGLLRRLEMGDIPVTAQGTAYLGVDYDLGEHNDARHVARRLTSDGKVALFDETRYLNGYFEAQPTAKTSVKTEVHKLSPDDIYVPVVDPNLAELERRAAGLENYSAKLYGFMHEDFFEKTGVNIADVSMRDQAAVIELFSSAYWSNLTQRAQARVYRFIRTHQDLALRALVSMTQQDPNRIQTLLQIDFALGRYATEQILKDHAQLLYFVETAFDDIAPLLEKKLGHDFDAKTWLTSLYTTANNYLERAAVITHELVATTEVVRTDAEYEPGKLDFEHTYITQPTPDGGTTWTSFTYEQLQEKLHPNNEDTVLSGYDTIVQRIAVELANTFNTEEIKALLNELPDASAFLLTKYLQPETPGLVKEDLRNLYAHIRFETYDLNQHMTPVELDLLRSWLSPDEPTLDAGCGTGRLLVPLAQEGFNVQGFDYTPRHVEVVRDELRKASLNPDLVQQGDWLQTSYEDETFETVTCLGRNILHEYRLERQRRFFSEMQRILRPGGKLIVDIPDRSIPGSHYERLAHGYRGTLARKGIYNTRDGTIFDSPDNQHFATRYVYDEQDIRALAEATGFEIETITTHDLPTGQGDKNIYFILRKVGQPAEQAQALAA